MPEPAKHTPGPLIACRCPLPDITIAPVDRGTLWLVRRNDGKNCGEIAITQGSEAKGNARLFAAAPDLLTACRRMVEALSIHHMGGKEPFPGDQQYADALDGLYAAIEKAAG